MHDRTKTLVALGVNGHPKLFGYVLTANGLVCFQSVNRNHVLGKDMTQDEYNKL